MKKIIYNKYFYLIMSILQFLLTFITDKKFFIMDSIVMKNYAFCKILVFLFLVIIWQLLYYIVKNSKTIWIKYFLIYFIPMIIILLLIFPGFMYGADVYIFIELSKKAEFLYFLNYLSSIFWISSIMIFPFYSMVMVMQTFIMGIAITYARLNLEILFPKNKLNNFIYIVGFMFSSILYILYPNRPIVYGILYLFMYIILFFDLCKKKSLSYKKIFILSILGGILSFWRNEGIYLIIALPFLLIFIYQIKIKSKKFVLICILPILINLLISIPQQNYMNSLGEIGKLERNVPNIVNPLSYMLTQNLNSKDLESDLVKINKVLDINKLKKYASLDEAVATWEDGGCMQEKYSVSDFKDMEKAYKNIVKNNFGLYFKSKSITFYHASRLKQDDFHSCNLYDNKSGGIFDTPLAKKFISFRKLLVKCLEGHGLPKIINIIYKIFNSLLIPLVTLVAICCVSFFKKKWKLFFLTGMPIGHALIVFAIAPASYFMYYFPVYLVGYFLFSYFIIKKFFQRKNKVLFVSSTGGHLDELMQLKTLFEKYEYSIITENTKSTKPLKKIYKNKIYFLIFGTREKKIIYIFKFTFNMFKSLYLYLKIFPNIIITTGTHTAVPICYIGKLFGSKIIFIETFANRNTATLSGKLIYPIANDFIVQWPEMLNIYPNAKLLGWIY